MQGRTVRISLDQVKEIRQPQKSDIEVNSYEQHTK